MDSKLHERFGELINSLSPEKRQELYSSLRAMEPSKREEVIASLVNRYETMKYGKQNQKDTANSNNANVSPIAYNNQSKQLQSEAKVTKIPVRRRFGIGPGMIILIVIVVLAIASVVLWKTGVIDSLFEKVVTYSESTTVMSDSSSLIDSSVTQSTTIETTPTETPTPTPVPLLSDAPDLTGLVVVIDPGHQAISNYEREPVASWLSIDKPSCTSGATGVVTGIHEYEITLQTGLMLRDYLVQCGATVVMTRTENDANVPNSARAQVAVDNGADVFIRLHADAANDSATSGVRVYVPDSGEYSSSVVAWADTLGELIQTSSGMQFVGTRATYDYTGLNYANSVPSFQICMGYLSNSDDEALLVTEAYQYEVVTAIAQFCTTFVE
jgi:N-acetylmuramoyl-L-alanine amidase